MPLPASYLGETRFDVEGRPNGHQSFRRTSASLELPTSASVIPAKAGIHFAVVIERSSIEGKIKMDPGFRRDDDREGRL